MKKALENLMNATIETIVEAIEQKPWTAFINNTVSFTGVMLNNRQLVEDIKEVGANPALLLDLEEKAIKRFGKKYENELVAKIFKRVWSAVIFNVNTVIAISEEVKESQHNKALK